VVNGDQTSIQNATVSAILNGEVVATAVTDGFGNATLKGLSPAKYKVKATKDGAITSNALMVTVT
jgi:hypothetical protein